MTSTVLGALGQLFDGPHATPTRQSEGPYFLNIASLNSGRLDLSLSDHVTPEDFFRWTRRVTPREGDLLFSYETRLGEAALMPANVQACLGRRMALLRPDVSRVDPRFLLYYYLSPDFQQQIQQRTIHGATVSRIGLSTMNDWPVSVPQLEVQRGIADVLGALDDKIAANTSESAVADALVRALYSAVPGTRLVRIGELCSSVRVQQDPPFVGGMYLGLEHLPRRCLWVGDRGDSAGLMSGKLQFGPGDCLFGKLRPYFHKVAVSLKPGVCSTDILVLRAKDRSVRGLFWAAVSSDSVVERVSAMAEGTKMPRTSWEDLAGVVVAWPDEQTARTLSDRVVAHAERADAAADESRKLAELRDTLLPALMSGRVSVREAEATVGAAL